MIGWGPVVGGLRESDTSLPCSRDFHFSPSYLPVWMRAISPSSWKTKTRSSMKFVLCLAALAAVYCCVDSTYSPPKVDVYSTEKGKYGEGNTLICNVRNFHPPDITIELLKDGQEIPDSLQTDLSFKQNWQFHLMRSVSFTPDDGHKYSCKITHISNVKQYGWEPNM